MTQETVKTKLMSFIFEKFPLARKKNMNDTSLLLQSGIVDSLGILELVAFIEQEFGITISDDELLPENFQTLEALTSFVQGKSGIGLDAEQKSVGVVV
jgi:acyl carrier protein